MATATQTPGPQRVNPRQDMVEVTAPEQFQFTKAGQNVEGVLLSIEPVNVKGKQALEYLFGSEDKKRFTILGTADLDKKLQPAHIGHWIMIRYEANDDSFTKPGQNAMKLFKVMVSRNPIPLWVP